MRKFKGTTKKAAVKKKKEVGCCFDCIHAKLMQSEKYNPIVSECLLNHDREVAKVFMCQSGNFERISGDTRTILPMEYIHSIS